MSLKPEQIAQINVINWFNENFPELKEDLHHFANERKCSVMEGRTLKKMGVRKGVPDLHLALPCGGYYGLWIELKVGNGRLSKEQKAFIVRKNQRDYAAFAIWESNPVKECIMHYLNGNLTNWLSKALNKQYKIWPNC